MKTMYLASINGELAVMGSSFFSEREAIENAEEWLDENGGDGPFDFVITEIDVPESATDDDFSSCADISDYEEIAGKLSEGE